MRLAVMMTRRAAQVVHQLPSINYTARAFSSGINTSDDDQDQPAPLPNPLLESTTAMTDIVMGLSAKSAAGPFVRDGQNMIVAQIRALRAKLAGLDRTDPSRISIEQQMKLLRAQSHHVHRTFGRPHQTTTTEKAGNALRMWAKQVTGKDPNSGRRSYSTSTASTSYLPANDALTKELKAVEQALKRGDFKVVKDFHTELSSWIDLAEDEWQEAQSPEQITRLKQQLAVLQEKFTKLNETWEQTKLPCYGSSLFNQYIKQQKQACLKEANALNKRLAHLQNKEPDFKPALSFSNDV